MQKEKVKIKYKYLSFGADHLKKNKDKYLRFFRAFNRYLKIYKAGLDDGWNGLEKQLYEYKGGHDMFFFIDVTKYDAVIEKFKKLIIKYQLEKEISIYYFKML